MLDAELLFEGRVFSIFGISVHGKCLIMEFMEGLPESEKIKILYFLRRTADNGIPKNREKFKKVEDKIFEFKSCQTRILCFFNKDRLIMLTHGFTKKKQKTPRKEIEKAKELMKAYLKKEKMI